MQDAQKLDTQDIYLNKNCVDRISSGKILDIYKSVLSNVPDAFDSVSTPSLLDIGCGNGELLNHFKTLKSSYKLSGIDLNNDLCEFAKQHLRESAEISCTSVSQYLPNTAFQVVTCCGVLPCFNSLSVFFNELPRLLVTNGILILNQPMSRHNFTLKPEWRFDGENYDRNGWTLHSFQSVVGECLEAGFELIHHENVNVSECLHENPSRPSAQFNITSVDGSKYYMNGFGLFFDIKTMVFRKM